NIYGGKITTYRKLAEAALAKLADFFILKPAWTAGVPLPGGNFDGESVDAFMARFRQEHRFLPGAQADRLVHAYGTLAPAVMGAATRLDDLGARFGEALTAAEVRYLIRFEWTQTADDILWRRSKLGLGLAKQDAQKLAHFMAGTTAVTYGCACTARGPTSDERSFRA